MNQEEQEFVMGIISAPEEIADGIAGQLVEEKLAAAAQVSSPVKSYYWWDDKMNCNPEVLIYIKTRRSMINRIRELLKKRHTYEVPEFIVLPIIGGNPDYLQWLDNTVL